MDKKNIVLMVLILILGLVVGFGCCYVYLDSKDDVVDTDKNKDIDNKIDKEDNKLSSAEINDLISIIDKLDFIDIDDKNIKSGEKLDNQKLLAFAFERLKNSMNYSLDEVNKVVNEYFGVNVIAEDYICIFDNLPLYKYNASTKMFNFYDGDENAWHAHDEDGSDIYNLYESSSKDGDIYTISVKKVFSEWYGLGPGAYTFYRNAKDAYERENEIFEIDAETEGEDVILSKAKDNFNKLNTYTYTFKKVNGNYVFNSYTK